MEQSSRMKKIVLVGNPNVGKSLIFSRLTGTKVITSNFPGTTVGITRGTVRCEHRACDIHQYALIDAPGIYSLKTLEQDAEHVAGKIIMEADVAINVLDATNLERNLLLTLELIKQNPGRVIVVLNLWDEARYHGISINTQRLSELLGAPVIPTIGLTGYGIKKLMSTAMSFASEPQHHIPVDQEVSWENVKKIVESVQQKTARRKRFAEYLETVTLSPVAGIIIAFFVLIGSFALVSYLGDAIESGIAAFLNFFYTPLLLKLHAVCESAPFFQQLLVGTVVDGTINYGEAMGMLTSGIYIPLAKVAPVVAIFYLVIGILEDCGYLPRLAILSDTLMHRFALHGFAIVPMVLGAGCNVTGVVATRILPNRKQRIIASLLLSLAIPCTSQTAMIAGLGAKIGFTYMLSLFGTLFLIWYIMGRVLGAQEQQSYSELLMEIPPYRMPHAGTTFKKLYYRLHNFFADAIPVTIVGICVLLVANYFHLFDYVATTIGPVAHTLWGLPPKVIPVLMMGLFRKEIAISFLDSFSDLSAPQVFVATLLLSLYFACISVYAVLYKEFGLRTFGMMVAVMFLISSIAGCCAHIVLSLL